MFRTIYFYSYIEVSEISKVKREEIAKILEITAETEEKFNVSLPYLMRNHEWKILNYYIFDAVESLKTGKSDPMEYFSRTGNAKILVWTYSAKLRFAFCFFAAADIYQPFPLEEYTKDVTNKQKKILCSIITEMFEIPTIKLKSDFIIDVRNIQKMLGKQFCLRSDLVGSII